MTDHLTALELWDERGVVASCAEADLSGHWHLDVARTPWSPPFLVARLSDGQRRLPITWKGALVIGDVLRVSDVDVMRALGT